MVKRIVLILAVGMLGVFGAATVLGTGAAAVYEADYSGMIVGPQSVTLGATESYTLNVYDPGGVLIKEVKFSRIFSNLGVTTITKSTTITTPEGSRQVTASLDVTAGGSASQGGDDGVIFTDPATQSSDMANRLVAFIDSAKSEILMAAYTIDNQAVVDALVRAAGRLPAGSVRVVIEERNYSDPALVSWIAQMQAAGVQIVSDGTDNGALMHNKFVVVDAGSVWTGSTNFTQNAVSVESNNSLVFNDAALAQAYQTEFNEMFNGTFDGAKTDNTPHTFTVDMGGATLVDINGASAADLQTLPGIGPSKAQAIISYRELNGPFASVDDLKNVSGIGASTVDSLRSMATASSGMVNINTASAEQLQLLPGIGATKAAAIVANRQQNGPFASVDDLTRVSGIGTATVNNLRSAATVSGLVGGTREVPVEAYFAPSDDVEDQLLNVIRNAKSTIQFSIFTFTSNAVAQALIDARARGVRVQGVFDAWQAQSSYSQYDDLLAAGLDVKKDGFNSLLHSKYLVADGANVVTGSYNWTNSANTENDENLLIVRDAATAAQYSGNFQQVYSQSNN